MEGDVVTRISFCPVILLFYFFGASSANHVCAQESKQELLWLVMQLNATIERDLAREHHPIVSIVIPKPPRILIGPTNQFSEEDIQRLQQITELEELTLADLSLVRPVALQHLAGLRKLKRLNLSATNISGEGIGNLGAIASLEELNLARCENIGDAEMKILAKIRSLKSLTLDSSSRTPHEDPSWNHAISVFHSAPPAAKARYLADQVKRFRKGVSSEGFSHLAELDLTYLSLQRTRVTDSAMEPISNMKNLRELNLNYTAVSDQALREISKLSSLSRLSLNYTLVSDEGMQALSQLPNLESLDLVGVAVSDKGIRQLGKMPNLKKLNVCNTHITDEGLSALAGLPKLVDLDIKNTRVSFQGLVSFADKKSKRKLAHSIVSRGWGRFDGDNEIIHLNLPNQSISDEDVKRISQFTQLQTLDLANNPITNRGLSELRDLTALTYLNVAGTQINDEGLSQLDTLTNLQNLNTKKTKVTFTGLRGLVVDLFQRPALDVVKLTRQFDTLCQDKQNLERWIDLRQMQINDDDLATVCEIPNLVSLKFKGDDLTDAGVRHLVAQQQLHTLWISGKRLTGKSLRRISKLPRLEMLWLTDSEIHDEDLSQLPTITHLKVLNLAGCPITNSAIPTLEKCRQLKTLIVDSHRLSDQSLARLKRELPDLEVIESQACALRAIRGRSRETNSIRAYSSRYSEQGSVRSIVVDHPLVSRFGDEHFERASHAVFASTLPQAPERLRELDTLESISFSIVDFPDGLMKQVRQIPNLKKFTLIRSVFNGAELKHLANWQELEELNLHRSEFCESELRELRGLTGIKRFSIGGYNTKVTDLEFLNSMPNLETLSISRTQVDDNDMKHVNKLTRLKNLTAREVVLLQFDLPGLKNLETIDLTYTLVNDDVFRTLQNHPKLKRVSIGSNYTTQHAIDVFKRNRPEVKADWTSVWKNVNMSLLNHSANTESELTLDWAAFLR